MTWCSELHGSVGINFDLSSNRGSIKIGTTGKSGRASGAKD